MAICGGCVTVDASNAPRRPISAEFAASGVDEIRLKLYAGSLTIVQAGTGNVSIEGDIKMHGWAGGKSAENLERMAFETSLDDGRLTIELPRRRQRYEARLTIAVPRDAALDVDLRYGEVHAELATLQSARIHLNAGEVDLRLPASSSADINARAAVGEVSIHGFDAIDGPAKRKKLVGARYSGDIGDGDRGERIDLKVTAGSIDIRGTD
jgi:hypothetical protein